MHLTDALAAAPVVAILRGVHPDEVVAHVEALFDAGVRAVEVPLNSPDPLSSIRRIASIFDGRMAIGAGTVIAARSVEEVAEAGGRFVVSPNLDHSVVSQALRLGLEPAPGFATPTEAFSAHAIGARHLKLFPAVTYGRAHLLQLKAVLPSDAAVWAVGGVGPEAMADWWAAGADAFGIGGELYRPGQSADQTAINAQRVMASAMRLPPRRNVGP